MREQRELCVRGEAGEGCHPRPASVPSSEASVTAHTQSGGKLLTRNPNSNGLNITGDSLSQVKDRSVGSDFR